jgi:hypothetical protein
LRVITIIDIALIKIIDGQFQSKEVPVASPLFHLV